MPQIEDKERYFDLIKDFATIPFTQSVGWHNYNHALKPGSIRYFVDDEKQPQMACFGHEKRLAGLKLLIVEGECYRQPVQKSKAIKALFETIKNGGFDLIEFDSYSIYEAEFEIGARKAGFRRPVGLFSTPMSLLVHTDKPLVFDRNWLRNIDKSSNLQMSCQEITSRSQADLADFLKIYNEMCSFKNFQYKINLQQLVALFSDPSMSLFALKNEQGIAVAYRIVHHHYGYATDVFAANSPAQNLPGATHYFVSSIIEALKDKGVTRFDFARVLYGYPELEKVAQFKSGIKAEHILYNGEWSWYKHPIFRPLMYFVKRYLMKRIEV